MKHAPSVVIVTWQRSEHCYSSLRYAKCSVSCIVSWQRSEHGYSSLRYETCSVSCHRFMTTVRVWLFISKYETCSVSCHRDMTLVRTWLFIPKVWNMLRQLSSWHDNTQSMVLHPLGMKHAPSVVIVTWQRSEHGFSSLRYETCSVSCHRDMTTVRAWLFIPKVWNMLRQLSSPHDTGQSMVIHLLGMKHAPSVVIVTWQRSEHGYSSLRYETCSVSCHRLMTTVRAWLYISFMYETCSDSCHHLMTMDRAGKKHAPSVVIVSWRRSEHGYTSFR